MLLKFEMYLHSINELLRVEKYLKTPEKCKGDDLSFYQYLELKKIYFIFHNGSNKAIKIFEDAVKQDSYNAKERIREYNRIKNLKPKKEIVGSKFYNCKTHIYNKNKKIKLN